MLTLETLLSVIEANIEKELTTVVTPGSPSHLLYIVHGSGHLTHCLNFLECIGQAGS